MNKGLVLSGPDKTIEAKAKGRKLGVTIDAEMGLAYDKTLFVEPRTEVPWDLLPAAWHFLERWDAAVPLWRYGVNAADVGSKAERKRTQAIVRDLRVLLHSVELLFVRDNADGRALMTAYLEELGRTEFGEGSNEKRLAFLRAFYRVKPRLCVLPRSWLAQIYQRSKMDARARQGMRRTAPRLVTVEIGPGRFVQCRQGDEAKVLAMAERRAGRRGRETTSVKRETAKVEGLEVKDYRHTAPELVTVEIEPGRSVKCYPGDEDRVLEMLTAGRA